MKLGRPSKVEFLVIRRICDDSLSVVFVPVGYKPGPSAGYTWGGPFPSCRAAFQAVGRADEKLREQLYPSKVKVTANRSPSPSNARET
jgi:hypothetical protein